MLTSAAVSSNDVSAPRLTARDLSTTTTMLSNTWRSSLAAAARPRAGRPFPRPHRLYSTEVPRSKFQRAKTFAKYTAYLGLSSVVGVAVVGAGILAHDAFTYNDKHVDRVPVNPLALNPERGGPKNLPIARVLIDDEEDEEAKLLAVKPRLVIVGGGWGVRA